MNDNGNASVEYQWMPGSSHPCNIVRMDGKEFSRRFGPSGLPPLYPHPLVILGGDDGDEHRNRDFQRMTQSDTILDHFPDDFLVTLSSSNSFSEHRRTIPLSQYLREVLTSETLPHQQSNETWYLFGETYSDEWKELLKHYQLPNCEACMVRDDDLIALSFGIGNRGSGVQWHVHGPGFSEAVHGRKHWILSHDKPDFHPDQTSLNWMEYSYTNTTTDLLKQQQQQKKDFYECTLSPGDLIYFPDMWWHATINLDPYTAFVSTFTQEHAFAAAHRGDDDSRFDLL
jgi:hypothetical protein